MVGTGDVPDGLEYFRRELNDTRASSIQIIEGISPPLYYYELEQTYVTRPGDIFGLRRTNQSLGIHFVIISSMSNGLTAQGDNEIIQCSFFDRGCNNAGVTAQPQFVPVYGKLATCSTYMYLQFTDLHAEA